MNFHTIPKRFTNKTLGWLIVSNIVKSASQWLLLIIFVKFFTDEDVGYYTYGMAIAAPIFMFSEMQLKSIFVVEPSTSVLGFPVYNFVRIGSVFLATIGLIGYCIIKDKINWIVILVIIYKSVESLIDILYGYLQRENRMVWMSHSDIVKSVLTLLLCFTLSWWFNKINIAIIGTIFASITMYVVDISYITNSCHNEKCTITLSKIVGVLKRGLPLGISVLFSSYITNYPRIAVEGLLGPDMLAYFGAYSYMSIGLFQIQIPVQTYLRQKLSNYFQSGQMVHFKRLMNKSIGAFLLYGVACIIGFSIVGESVIDILYKESYVSQSNVMYLVLLGQLLTCLTGLYSIAILSFNIYTKQVFITAIAFIVVFLSSNYMIKCYGLTGAGLESVIAGIVSLLAYASLYYKRVIK